jgi:hypothetical protein
MTGSILLGVGCFALGGLVGFYSALLVLSHSVAHNVKGIRDMLKKAIAKAEGVDRTDRAMESMLAELKAKKVEQ